MNTNDSFNQTKTVTARIVSVHKNRFQIALDSAERKAAEHDAVLAGRLLYRGEIPVVGDYIEAEFETSPVGKPVGDARIVSILPRKSLITRPEYRVGTQNMAANVDICFLVVSANADFSVNRIARYASAVLQGGSKPVVVLTKADLCSDLSEYMHRITEICGNIQMHCVSSKPESALMNCVNTSFPEQRSGCSVHPAWASQRLSTPFSEGKLCARAIFAKRTTRGGTQQRIGSLSRRTAFFLWTLRACANSAFARRKRGFTKFFGILKKQHGNAVSATAPTKTSRAVPFGRRLKTVCSRKSNTICILLCKPRTVCGPQAKNGRKRTKNDRNLQKAKGASK